MAAPIALPAILRRRGMFGELMGVVGMANETNRLANGYRVPVDPAFELANGEWRVVSSE